MLYQIAVTLQKGLDLKIDFELFCSMLDVLNTQWLYLYKKSVFIKNAFER